MKYLKHYFAQSSSHPSGGGEQSTRPRHSTFQTSNTSKSKRPSSFEDNLAESCIQTKKMIDDYENQVGAMKKKRRDRNGLHNVYNNINNNNVYTASKHKKQQSRGGDRYQVYGGNRQRHASLKQPVMTVLEDGGDTDSLTSLTDDLTYLHQSARRETAHTTSRHHEIAAVLGDTASILSIPGSAANPLDVTATTIATAATEDDRRDEDRYAGSRSSFSRKSNNTRNGDRFSSNRSKDSIRHHRSLLNDDDDDDDDDDNGEADEDWPGARIPLPTAAAAKAPSRKQKQPKRRQRQQSKNDTQSDTVQSTIQRLMDEFSAVLGETHIPEPTSFLSGGSSSGSRQNTTERLKRSLRDQRQKFDQEKGALHMEMERIKRDHGVEVDRLQSDLHQAQESHQMYLKKLTEVIDYHEVLHEKETATMNKIVEQVKKEKREEVSTLTQALEELKSSNPNRYPSQTSEDPDIRECIQYLSDESDAQQHRRSQFMDTMVALQSIALKRATSGGRSASADASGGFSKRDIQDIDGLLDMLHHVYSVSETSHQNTLCMSHMLIEECTRISHQTHTMLDSEPQQMLEHRLDFFLEDHHEQEQQEEEEDEEFIRTRVEEEEEEYRQGTHLDLRQQQEVCGGNSFDEFTQTMERNLYRGLGLIP